MWQKIKKWYHRTITDRPLSPGYAVGPYEIKSVLGLGSYGIAYLAADRKTGKPYVAKQVKPSLYSLEKGLALQQYEKKVLDAISHPQIPRAIEHIVNESKKQAFLIMDFIQGQTIEELLFERDKTFTEREAAQLILEIARLVEVLHNNNIIHRDVRIPNVIVEGRKPYLIDFGLARFVGDGATYIAQDMEQYPPEKQLKRAVAPSSDLYCLGHFFLFLLYSTFQPEETVAETDLSWEEELMLAPELRRMIRKLLQLDSPYQSIHEFLCDLKQYLECPAGEN